MNILACQVYYTRRNKDSDFKYKILKEDEYLELQKYSNITLSYNNYLERKK